MTETRQHWIALVARLTEVAEALEAAPELRPLALKMLGGDDEGFGAKVGSRAPHTPRVLSAARRKQMSISAKKRWAKAKRAGKNTIGGAD